MKHQGSVPKFLNILFITMDNIEDKPKITIVENPIPVGCPRCWNMIRIAHMENEYIVYRCKMCGWETPRQDYFQIDKSKDET